MAEHEFSPPHLPTETAPTTVDTSLQVGSSATTWRRALARLRLGWGGWLGLVLVLVFAFVAVAAPLLAPNDPTLPHPGQGLAGPSAQFPLGTDNLGRCVLSRLIYGSRLSLGTDAFGRDQLSRLVYGARTALVVGFVTSFAGASLGALLGTIGAYFGGCGASVARQARRRIVTLGHAAPRCQPPAARAGRATRRADRPPD